MHEPFDFISLIYSFSVRDDYKIFVIIVSDFSN